MLLNYIPASHAILSAAGFYYLWIVMLKSGAAETIKASVRAKRLPDGTRLTAPPSLARVFGNSLFAQIAFYDGVMDGQDPAHHILMSELHPQIQVILSCIMLRSNIGGKSVYFSEFALPIWNALNLSWGSAVVFPVYMLVSSCNLTKTPTPPFHTTSAVYDYSNTVSILLGLILPLMLIYPTACPSPAKKRHALIAYHRMATICLSFSRPVLRFLLSLILDEKSIPAPVHTGYMLHWFLASYSAFFHIRALLLCFKGRTGMFWEVFIPYRSGILRSKGMSLGDAAHLFLQYDLLIVAFATFVYCMSLIMGTSAVSVRVVPLIALGEITFGPGAMAVLAQGFHYP